MSNNQRYEYIINKIKEARMSGNTKQLKMWRNKLEKWQQQYGAYSPLC